MDASNSAIHTEIRELDLCLKGFDLALSADGKDLIAPISLSTADAERLRLEMAKAQLPEWNQLEELQLRAELRYRRYLASWLVMCLAAFSAYLGYPSFYLPLFLAALSILLWWRAGLVEKQAEKTAQEQRNQFRADWDYVRRRMQETSETG